MSTLRHVNRVLIGDGVEGTSSIPNHLSGILPGQLLLCDENLTPLNGTSVQNVAKFDKVYIAVGLPAGGHLLSSPIQGNTVSAYIGTEYVAPVESVTYLGYNGTEGNITVTAGDEYRLRIAIKDDARIQGQRMTLLDSNYVATDVDIAASVISELISTILGDEYGQSEIGKNLCIGKVGDATPLSAIANLTATIPTGSTSVLATGSGTAPAVGDVIQLQASGSTSDFIYFVEEVTEIAADTYEIVIDQPFQGANYSGAILDGGTVAGLANVGIKIIGKPVDSLLNPFGNEPYNEYEWVNFDAGFSKVGDAAPLSPYVAPKTANDANPGQGVWKQVSDAEKLAKGYLGDDNRRSFDSPRVASSVVPGATYDSIIITHADVHLGNLQDMMQSPLQTEVYLVEGTTQASDFVAILDAYFATIVGFEPSGL